MDVAVLWNAHDMKSPTTVKKNIQTANMRYVVKNIPGPMVPLAKQNNMNGKNAAINPIIGKTRAINFPKRISGGVSSVKSSISQVCCSFSWEIAFAVKAGASIQIRIA